MNKKLISLVACLLTVTLVAGFYLGTLSRSYDVNALQGNGVTGHVTVAVKRAGESEFTTIFEGDNIVVTQGLGRVRDFLAFYNHSGTTNANCTKWISLSSSSATPIASWTVITSEINTGGGLDRDGSTPTVVNSTAFQVQKTFTADTTYTDVQLTGLNTANDDGTNTLWAAISFSATKVTLSSGDSIQITWTVNCASG